MPRVRSRATRDGPETAPPPPLARERDAIESLAEGFEEACAHLLAHPEFAAWRLGPLIGAPLGGVASGSVGWRRALRRTSTSLPVTLHFVVVGATARPDHEGRSPISGIAWSDLVGAEEIGGPPVRLVAASDVPPSDRSAIAQFVREIAAALRSDD